MFRFGDPGGAIYGAMGTSNANFLALWSSVSGTSPVVTSGVSRTGGPALVATGLQASYGASNIGKVLDNQATLGVTFAIKTNVGVNAQTAIASFYDVSTLQCSLVLNADGSFSILRGSTVLGTTSPGIFTTNVWVHIEFMVTFSSTVGTAYLAVNGVQKLSLTSQNTQITGHAYASTVNISVSNGSANLNVSWCDIIMYDGQTTDGNGFTDITGPIGNCYLQWLLPTGAGATTQWTPLSGANYAQVNATTVNGGSTYVYDPTVGHKDTYAMASLSGAPSTISSVAAIHYAEVDAGTHSIASELYSGGGYSSHAIPFNLGAGYQYYFSNWGQNPNNGSPTNWTPTSVNAVQAGQVVSS